MRLQDFTRTSFSPNDFFHIPTVNSHRDFRVIPTPSSSMVMVLLSSSKENEFEGPPLAVDLSPPMPEIEFISASLALLRSQERPFE